jgi:DNA-binding transcriptional MerR regulator
MTGSIIQFKEGWRRALLINQYLPGTQIRLDSQVGPDYRSTLTGAFAITGGVYLSQISDMIGVSGVTLQNWVKRGYVSSPVNKRYTLRQTARIILIALLRHALSLDDIVTLLSAINRNLADEGDDLIDDTELYLYFCDLAYHLEPSDLFDPQAIQQTIARTTRNYTEKETGAHAKLNDVLQIMIEAYAASLLREQVAARLARLKGERDQS